jgi:DNA-binding MarR family transcriptional regulator
VKSVRPEGAVSFLDAGRIQHSASLPPETTLSQGSTPRASSRGDPFRWRPLPIIRIVIILTSTIFRDGLGRAPAPTGELSGRGHRRRPMVFSEIPLTRLIGYATGVGWNVQRITERALRPLGLTYAQLGLLSAVLQKDGQSQRELAVRLEGDSTTVMVIVDSLERKGLVVRRPDARDRRVKRISLTPAGAKAARAAVGIVKGLYEPMLEEFPTQEIEVAEPVMERMYLYLKQRSAEGRARTAGKRGKGSRR